MSQHMSPSPNSPTPTGQVVLLDGSRLIAESCARAGVDSYVGYPITPASLIYTYCSSRMPAALPAPDEISALQWMCGLSAAGCLPMTATSFPGFALMLESINMAHMIELPMLIVLVQRLGPSTGSATAGAQGDLYLLNGLLSGGYPMPVFSIASLFDCWRLPPIALQTALDLRTPVVLLTSKEMVMTLQDLDLSQLEEIPPLRRQFYAGSTPYIPYAAADRATPPFLPLGDSHHQVRLNASTHDPDGIIRHTAPAALENTRRLARKIENGMPLHYELDEEPGARTLVVSWDVTSGAARQAVRDLRQRGDPVSLFIPRTLLPLPDEYYAILERYPNLVFAEENLQGQLAHLFFGARLPENVHLVTAIGRMIQPAQIVAKVADL